MCGRGFNHTHGGGGVTLVGKTLDQVFTLDRRADNDSYRKKGALEIIDDEKIPSYYRTFGKDKLSAIPFL